MTASSLDNIRRSYEQMIPSVDRVTSVFYDRLFSAWPGTRQLFSAEMDVQRRHFAAALALIVRNLTVLDTLEQPLRELGAAHAKAGVRTEHYPAMCDAMIFAMAETLGSSWSDEVAIDWRSLLETVARHMLAGALDSRL